MVRTSLLTLIASILMSCSRSEDNVSANIHADILAAQTASVQTQTIAMSVSKPCGTTMRQRTSCMIELILADVRDNYNEADGGGIGDINGHSSTSYTVSLPQEERLDLFRYEFDVSPTAVTMKSKTPGAR